ncbi:aldolase/citrate lyase family protein [Iodidimonas sp. SYSU 1G8]|uniref:aldolase/citrate lyase family protein n=1 Tax=Iodidimonas sp. SYSU 1G8 TaxID=3133967 RepID=UPI0031FE7873
MLSRPEGDKYVDPLYSHFVSLKGEFEAEGLTRDEIAAEVLFAARRGLDYVVKIGGCEAKSDCLFLQQLGVRSIVAPMIETAFAMEKYMGMLPLGFFDNIGVTIETFTAVNNIEEILDAGTRLTNVTIGRTDLNASFRGPSVDSPVVVDKVKIVARAARKRGLLVTMGGSINSRTRELLRADGELRSLLHHVETRKAVLTVAQCTENGALEAAIDAEHELLNLRTVIVGDRRDAVHQRMNVIRSRI